MREIDEHAAVLDGDQQVLAGVAVGRAEQVLWFGEAGFAGHAPSYPSRAPAEHHGRWPIHADFGRAPGADSCTGRIS